MHTIENSDHQFLKCSRFGLRMFFFFGKMTKMIIILMSCGNSTQLQFTHADMQQIENIRVRYYPTLI